jgi:hypothetical protein
VIVVWGWLADQPGSERKRGGPPGEAAAPLLTWSLLEAAYWDLCENPSINQKVVLLNQYVVK